MLQGLVKQVDIFTPKLILQVFTAAPNKQVMMQMTPDHALLNETNLNVGIDGGGIKDRPECCAVGVHSGHRHETIDEWSCISLFQEHADR